jgi:hypothetical protein
MRRGSADPPKTVPARTPDTGPWCGERPVASRRNSQPSSKNRKKEPRRPTGARLPGGNDRSRSTRIRRRLKNDRMPREGPSRFDQDQLDLINSARTEARGRICQRHDGGFIRVIPPGRKSPFAAVRGLGRGERPGEFAPAPVDLNGLISSLAVAAFRMRDSGIGDSPKKRRKGNMPFTFTSNGKGSKCGHESFISSHHPADYAPVTCLGCGPETEPAIATLHCRIFDR